MTDRTAIPQRRDEPNLVNLLAVLRREMPARPTLFEFFPEPRYSLSTWNEHLTLYGLTLPAEEVMDHLAPHASRDALRYYGEFHRLIAPTNRGTARFAGARSARRGLAGATCCKAISRHVMTRHVMTPNGRVSGWPLRVANQRISMMQYVARLRPGEM